MKKIVIEGMMCDNCKKHVENTLNKIGKKVKVNLKDGIATFIPNDDINEETIKEKIEELEYKVVDITNI